LSPTPRAEVEISPRAEGQSERRIILMREKDIEQKLVKEVEAAGGWAPKFVSPGNAGMPDRVILFPGGRIAFIELKAPGKKLRPLQAQRMRKLKRLGFHAETVDGADQIDSIICRIKGGDAE
jgi:hypothetical protein